MLGGLYPVGIYPTGLYPVSLYPKNIDNVIIPINYGLLPGAMRLNFKIIIEQPVTKNGYNEFSYADPITVMGNYQSVQEMNPEGDDIIESAWVQIPSGIKVTPNTRITLPDGTQPPIMSVKPMFNFRTGKTAFLKITLGKMEERV
jgi:hypothetical protein